MTFIALEIKFFLSYFLNIVLKDQKQLNLPEIEQKVLEFWRENNVFLKTLSQSKGKKPFVFYEGPPTANNKPGLHHVLARIFKDIIPRYKTMRGFHVARRAGWDTQGLPVEIEIEKKLGIKNKQEIEKFGIAKFNQLAKESVWQYKEDWEKLTERIGFWLDMEKSYITYANDYLEKLWGIFKQVHKKGLLKKFYKVVPWCPRCQTSLSSHELGQPGAYKKIADPSVYIKFKIKNQKSKIKNNEFLLVWTTTPWTLPANVAVAVNPGLTYTKFKIGDEFLWSANTPPFSPETKIEVVEKLSGGKLEGLEYEPLYKNKGLHKIFAAGFVSAEEGTGLVHIAPAFGEDDLNLMKDKMPARDIPVTVNDQAIIIADVPGKGKFIKESDKDILADLENRNLLYYQTAVEHEYPFCWRCNALLIYFAKTSWFIEMSRLRNDLIKENKKINWIPENLKEGRFGEWIKEVKDWAISRERYWGTPLPIWECQKCDEILVAGGLIDLDKNAYQSNNFFVMRHGEATHNIERKIACSDRDHYRPQLTEKGIKQAEATAKKLRNEKIDLIYASPFSRTRQTVDVLKKYLKAPVVFDDRLKEINCGDLDGKPIKEYANFFVSVNDKFGTPTPNGESRNDVKKRMLAFVKEINAKHHSENILIVSHADPLWLLEVALNNVNNEEASRWNYLGVGDMRPMIWKNWPFNDNAELDLHRPYIDAIYLRCPKCKNKMQRVKEVADVWFDSGGMPFASGEYDAKRYPADYICEAIDQTRGWFYTLLAVGILLKKGTAYKNVISLGLILDKDGQKMSKSKGNTVDPWEIVNKYGVDVLRWYFYTINPPGEPKKFDEADLGKTRNRFHNLLFNSYIFWETYSEDLRLKVKDLRLKNILDRWILARFNKTVNDAVESLDRYGIGEAAKTIEVFVDDLSRWYIRRSRKRPEALPILGGVLLELSKLIAPFTPFFAEALYLSLTINHSLPTTHLSKSVHLESWPKSKKLSKEEIILLEQMTEVRRLASLALAKRAEAGIKVRQPLQKLKIKNEKLKIKELLNILADEVNIKEVVFDGKIKDEIELDTKITPELKNEGVLRELARMVQGLRHDAGYQSQDKIVLAMILPKNLRELVEKNEAFKKEVNAEKILFEKTDKFDKEKSEKLDQDPIWLAVKKL